MNSNINRYVYLKNLIELFHPKSAKNVIENACDEDLAEMLNQITPVDITLKEMHVPTEVLLNDWHYSWLETIIDSMPKELHPLFIGSLSRYQKRGIAFIKKKEGLEKIKIAPPTRKLFLSLLREKVEQDGIFNIHFLQKKPLTILLTLDKSILIELLDLIGLYDLAAKMKTIIDKRIISSINHAFTDKKRQFLHAILSDKKKGPAFDLDLKNWNGDANILKKMIHKRGLYKLSLALSGYPQDFMWHLTKRFDIGRGKILLNYSSEKEHPLASALTEQILFIINTLTQKSH